MDPDLMKSLHLEGNPRRDQFRRVRERIAAAAGCHTIAGNIRIINPELLTPEAATLVPADIPVKAGVTNCCLIDRGRKLSLKVGLNSVGRLPDNDVVIDDATVSRRHCAVVIHSDLSVELHDVASKNGTLLNGKKIGGPSLLQDGDEITLCERRLKFSITPIPRTSNSVSPAVSDQSPSSSWSGDHTQAGLSKIS